MATRSIGSFLILAAILLALPSTTTGQCSGTCRISVSPQGGSVSWPANTSGHKAIFTVQNVGPNIESGNFWCTVSGPVTCTSMNPTTYFLNPNQSMTDTVTYSVGVPGPGVLTLNAAYGTGYSWGYYNVWSLGPRPVVQVFERFQGTKQVPKCIADCFDAVFSYATPPYFSQDVAHSVALQYRSGYAHPMAFVSMGAWDTSSVHPTRMSLQLKRSDGAFVTFANGATEFFFACDSTGGYIACDSTSNRLAVQFDASSLATGLTSYTILARTYRLDGSFFETQDSVYLLTENQTSSAFGAGWTIAGYQRLYTVSTSLLITDGDGSIGYFRTNSPGCSGTCTYISPPGDFSKVTKQGVDSWGAIYTRRYPDGMKVGFRSDGLMVYLQDAFGNTTLWRYNASNQLAAIRDPIGKDDSLGYVSGKLRWIKDPGGRVDSITVDASGNLTRIRDAVGGLPFQGSYDSFHRLTHWTDRRASGWGVSYDFASKVQADTAPPITTVHGAGERPVSRLISLETAMLSDTALHLGSSANPAPGIDARVIRAKTINARGIPTSFVLNSFRQATRVEAPLGRTTVFKYDTAGRRTIDSLPEGLGHVIRYTWSGANLTQLKDSGTGRIVNYNYSSTYNLLTLMWGDVDSVISVVHGGDGAYLDSTRIGGALSWTKFTGFGGTQPHECRVTGPDADYWATCVYHGTTAFKNTDSIWTRRGPAPPYGPYAWTFSKYDGHGQRIRVISPVGDTTWTQYDSLGRVTKVIGPLHDTTSYAYDSLYLVQLRDAKGQVYKVWRNAMGWPDSTQDAAGKLTRFTYDSSGNPVVVTNRRGQSIQMVYDSLDQVRTRIIGSDTTRYFTDPLGRFVSVASRESIDTIRADAVGRPAIDVSCRVLVAGNAPQCFRDSSVYEIRDLRTKLAVTAPGLWTTHLATYHYDNHMLLDTLTNFTGEKEGFTVGRELHDSTRKFLAMGNLTATYGRITSPWTQSSASLTFNDTSLSRSIGVAYSFDTLARITSHYHGKVATPDTIRFFAHSPAGLARFADTAFTWSSPACTVGVLGESCDYSRVVSKNAVGLSGLFYYDSVGNRKDSPSQAYGPDPGNRLRRLGYVRFDYDLDGNVTRKRILKQSDTTQVVRTDSLFWSAMGSLDSLHSRDSTQALSVRVTYGYDGWGRQVRQSTTGLTSRYLWDGGNRIFMLDSLGSRIAYWTFIPGTTEPQSVAFTACCGADTTMYFVTDGLYNTVALLKSNGGTYQLHNQFRYGPFGDSVAVTGSTSSLSRLRYKGAFYDDLARLYLMGARYYDPDVGRFVSEDPLGLEAGINLYTFGTGDPVDAYDPDGTCGLVCGIVATAIVDYLAYKVSNSGTLAFQQGPCAPPGPKPPPQVAENAYQGQGPGCEANPGWVKIGIKALLGAAVIRFLAGVFNVKASASVLSLTTPSCRRSDFFGNTGFIHVQTSPAGFLQWGAYTYNPLRDFGDWYATAFVNGVQVDQKKPPAQWYPPHGSLPPSKAPSGSYFSLEVEHHDYLGGEHWSGANACLVP